MAEIETWVPWLHCCVDDIIIPVTSIQVITSVSKYRMCMMIKKKVDWLKYQDLEAYRISFQKWKV